MVQKGVAQGKVAEDKRLSSVCKDTSKPTSRLVVSEVNNMANKNAQLVPLVRLGGKEFLVDVDNRKFVDINDLNHCVHFIMVDGC